MKRKVLITGASRGIGAACARAFSQNGDDVIINYNSSEHEAVSLAEELGCQAFKADVSVQAQTDAMFNFAGDVDVLVCSAGISLWKLFTDTTPEDWNRVFSVNVGGVYNCCRRAIPGMVHKKYGRIITVSSMWGETGASCEAAYSASKAAVIGLTKALAKELGPSGITVNCISPGVIKTDMNSQFSAEIISGLIEETPVGRLGNPDDIAEAALFLASEQASFVTGQIFGVNGGFLI